MPARISQIIADVPGYRAPGASLVSQDAGTAAAQASSVNVAPLVEGVSRLARQAATEERRRREAEASIEAQSRTSAFKADVEALENRLMAAPESNVPAMPTADAEPDVDLGGSAFKALPRYLTYLPQLKDELNKLAETHLNAVGDPLVKQLLIKDVQRIAGDKFAKGYDYARSLETNTVVARVDESIANAERAASYMRVDSPDYAEIVGGTAAGIEIARRNGRLKDDVAQKKQEELSQRAAASSGLYWAGKDPVGFLTAAEKGQNPYLGLVGSTRYQQMHAAAISAIGAFDKDLENKRRAMEKYLDGERDTALKEIDDALLVRKNPAESSLLIAKHRSVLKHDQYLSALLRVETFHNRPEKDDPAAEREMNDLLRSARTPGTIAAAERRLSQLSRHLRPETDRTLQDGLRVRREALDAKSHTFVRDQQAEIEKELNKAIPAAGRYGETKQEASQLVGEALSDLDRATVDFAAGKPGAIAPRQWWEQNKSRYQSRASEAGSARLGSLKSSLRTVLDDSGVPDQARANKHATELLQRDPSGQLLYKHIELLREYEDLRSYTNELRESAKRSTPAGAASGKTLGRQEQK